MLVLTVCEKGQGVSSIANNATLNGRDILPRAFLCLDLKPRHVLREEQTDAAKVSMAAVEVTQSPVPLVLSSAVVYHVAKVVVRNLVVIVRLSKVVLRQLKDNCDEYKELARHLLPYFTVKAADFFPILLDHLVLRYVCPLGNVFVDVELCMVKYDDQQLPSTNIRLWGSTKKLNIPLQHFA